MLITAYTQMNSTCYASIKGAIGCVPPNPKSPREQLHDDIESWCGKVLEVV